MQLSFMKHSTLLLFVLLDPFMVFSTHSQPTTTKCKTRTRTTPKDDNSKKATNKDETCTCFTLDQLQKSITSDTIDESLSCMEQVVHVEEQVGGGMEIQEMSIWERRTPGSPPLGTNGYGVFIRRSLSSGISYDGVGDVGGGGGDDRMMMEESSCLVGGDIRMMVSLDVALACYEILEEYCLDLGLIAECDNDDEL